MKSHPKLVILTLVVVTTLAALGLSVNPWPHDGWYETQYFLIGSFPGQDDYTPIAAPALLYALAHALSAVLHWGLESEFRVASALQSLLVLLSACFVYFSLRLMHIQNYAASIASAFLLFILSTGLPQAFWSETVILFLNSAVIFILAALLHDSDARASRFWWRATLAGILIGLAVVTRVTPVLLVPAIAVLLVMRMPVRSALQFSGVIAVITFLAAAGAMAANHARFGRYELTNSAGRHLWQGIKDYSDLALSGSPDYEALKRGDPDLQGRNWWQIAPLLEDARADPREPLLGKLAQEAIQSHPLLYLMRGTRKFARTIGVAPFRLGYSSRGRHRLGCARAEFHAGRSCRSWDPLNRQDPLPSAATTLGLPRVYSVATEAFLARLHAIFRRLYPVTIFVILSSYLALLTETLIGSCRGPPERSDLTLFSFLVGVFFGTLWLSWQMEVGNTRNTVPYLPFWALLLAMAIRFWAQRWAALRSYFKSLITKDILFQ
jgi:hypothetical protein